jgi:hypothetical protein
MSFLASFLSRLLSRPANESGRREAGTGLAMHVLSRLSFLAISTASQLQFLLAIVLFSLTSSEIGGYIWMAVRLTIWLSGADSR